MSFSFSILSAFLQCLFQGLCPSSNPTCLSLSVTPIRLWMFSPTLFVALSAPSYFLSLSRSKPLLCVCVCLCVCVWAEVMKRDTRYVKGHHRLRMEEVSGCQLSGREASVSLSFSLAMRPTNQLLFSLNGFLRDCCVSAETACPRPRIHKICASLCLRLREMMFGCGELAGRRGRHHNCFQFFFWLIWISICFKCA